jgi:hypothetical protein
VLVYGFASLVTAFAGAFTSSGRLPLIYVLIFFPVLVLVVFSWLWLRRVSDTGSRSVRRDSFLGCSSQEQQRNDNRSAEAYPMYVASAK